MITSITKAADILKLFLGGQAELSLKDISEAVGLHKSSVYRTLATLVAAGFLDKTGDTNRYHLGLIFLDFAGHVLSRYDFRNRAKPFLEELAGKTEEIIHLSILEGNEIIYLEKVGQAQPLTVATKIWGRHPSHCSAMGKVLLSGLSREDRIKVLGRGPYTKMTENTITNFEVLSTILDCVQDQGYAIDDEEAFPGIRCVAAPIKEGRDGRVIAAISATVPVQRMDEARTMDMAGMLMETAGNITDQVAGFAVH